MCAIVKNSDRYSKLFVCYFLVPSAKMSDDAFVKSLNYFGDIVARSVQLYLAS
jgi:hypothetical protein